MLEYIELKITGMLFNKSIQIKIVDNRIDYCVHNLSAPAEKSEFRTSDMNEEEVADWIENIDRLNIGKENFVCDYKSLLECKAIYKLKMKYDNGDIVGVFCNDISNPYAWNELLFMIDTVSPKFNLVDSTVLQYLFIEYEDENYHERIEVDLYTGILTVNRETENAKNSEISYDLKGRIFNLMAECAYIIRSFPVSEKERGDKILLIKYKMHWGDMIHIFANENEDELISEYFEISRCINRYIQSIMNEDYKYASLNKHKVLKVRTDNKTAPGSYLSDDVKIKAGDYVWVSGNKGLVNGKVEKVEYFSDNNLPCPLKEMKKIRGKVETEKMLVQDSFLNENINIEKALLKLSRDNSNNTIVNILSNIYFAVDNDHKIFLPVEVEYPNITNSKKEISFLLRRLNLVNGTQAYAVFTSRDEALSGPETLIVEYPIKDFLRIVTYTRDVVGVVINPWHYSYFLSKEFIKIVLRYKR